MGATGEVHGIDAAPEMIEVARKKASRLEREVLFEVGLIAARMIEKERAKKEPSE